MSESKNKDKPKHIDNLNTSFADKPISNAADAQKEEEKRKEKIAEIEKAILGDNPVIVNDNGKKVYARNKDTGEMIFYDSKGEHVDLGVIDKLETAYGKYPERLPLGQKKKGDLQVRFVKEQFNEEKNMMETVEVPYEECELISERQDYADKDGNVVEAITNTITKNHHSLVKLLRDEIKTNA